MRKDVKKHMLSDIQLNADKYPMITFQSTGCEGSGTEVTLNGNFTRCTELQKPFPFLSQYRTPMD